MSLRTIFLVFFYFVIVQFQPAFSATTGYKIAFLDTNECAISSKVAVSLLCLNNISNVSGFDVEITFDNSKVIPTDTIIFNNDLINSKNIGYLVNKSNGKVNISIYLNGNGGNLFFNGKGTVVTMLFKKTANFQKNDSVLFLAKLTESYDTHTTIVSVSPGIFSANNDLVFNGLVVDWTKKNKVIEDSNCFVTKVLYDIKANKSINTSCNGSFVLHNQNDKFQLSKSLDSKTDAIAFINGYDAFLTSIVAVEDPSYIPTVYQLIAMDVNKDGVISAGDISQINKRTVKAFESFSPVNSNTSDWIFIDNDILNTNNNFKISSIYPDNDGKGYSKNMVPKTTSDFTLNGCLKAHKTYTGILLGDADGNYSNASNSTTNLKSNSIDTVNKVLLDFKNAVTSYQSGDVYIDVPVIVKSNLGINSFDFSLQNDENKLQYLAVISPNSLVNSYSYYNKTDKTIRFTSYSKTGSYDVAKPIVLIRFKIINDGLSNGSLNAFSAYINGDNVSTIISLKESAITFEPSHIVEVYPNPATDVVKIVVSKTSQILILSEFNQVIYTLDSQEANQVNSISLEGLLSGIYYIKVTNSTSTTTKIFVKH